MKTQNWHELDHTCDTVSGVGDMTCLQARQFERSHKHLKRTYSLSSKTTEAVLNEVTNKRTDVLQLMLTTA